MPQRGVSNANLSKEQIDAIKRDFNSRRAIQQRFVEIGGRKFGDNEELDWRDWNYSRTRARDLLPAQPPTWLDIPELFGNYSNYEASCAAFIPAELPPERSR